jgi:REP element-mobilizing transposase RayT
VTFRTLDLQLSEVAREAALAACRFWHGKKMTLHIVAVMPDHVHFLTTPYVYPDESAVPLAELVHSIKSYSANQINRLLGRSGPLWMQERFDRVMRNEREFVETWEYIETNAERAGLGENYRWIWKSDADFEEGGFVHQTAPTAPPTDRLEAGETQKNRLEADTTPFACVVVKHTNPCGASVGNDALTTYEKAYLADPNAAMGGILACSFNIDPDFASAVMDSYARWGKDAGAGGFFIEVWVAPSFDEDAAQVIRTAKKWGENVRLLAVGDMSVPPSDDELQYRSIAGGMLVQTPDLVGLNEEHWNIVTKRAPTDAEMDDLRLAWLIAKHTKSNAISIVKDGMLIGNGAGQMSRVMSCRIATWLANENGHAQKLKGSAAASDAFFPFRDGPDLLIEAGVTAIIQPGGSKRDADTIAACDARGVAMIFTGTRHFRH